MSAFRQLDMERYLANRMGEAGLKVFAGLTTPESRRHAFRAAILDGDLAEQILGRNATGKVETLSAFYERLYGEPLHVKQLELV